MNRIWRDGMPAFAASITLLLAAIVEVWMPSTGSLGYHVDTIFNAVFVVIAVLGGVVIGLPAKEQSERWLAALVSNLLIPILAFPMNIAVFGHKINWNAPLENLWSGHIGWLFCAVLQLFILSDLRKQIINWIRRFWALGLQAITVVYQAVKDFIKTHDKGVIVIMIVSLIMWAAFLVCRVYLVGTIETLADVADTLIGSLIVWIACVLAGAIVYTTPLIFRKVKAAVEDLKPEKILFAVLAVSALVVMFIALLILLKIVDFLMMLIIFLCLACFIIGGTVWRGHKNQRPETQNITQKSACTVNPRDLTTVLLSFCVAPLMLLTILTINSPQGQEILKRGQLDITSCLDYVTAFCNVASATLQLFI